MKSLFLTAAVSALALGANAQISIIPEAGVSLSNYRTNIAGKSSTSSTNAGVRAGVNVGIGIGNNLSIQPGLFFAMKGGNMEETNYLGSGLTVKTDTRFNYLELPLNIVYYFGDNQSGFFLNAGAYAGMLLSAKSTGSASANGVSISADTTYSIGGNEQKDAFRRWDIGFQGGAGYQLRNGLMIRAQYMIGAMNIQNHNNSDYSTRNGMLNIGVGYKFGF